MTKEYIIENLLNKNKALNPNKTKYLQETPEELYLIYNGCKSHKCYCGSETKFITFTKGYKLYCSSKCANNSPDVQLKKKKTLLKNYGVESPLQSVKIREKAENTAFSRYGNKNNYEKIKSTRLELYNDENYNNREKAEDTCLVKYGFKNFSYTESFQDIIRKIPIDQMDDFSYYGYMVWKITKKQKISSLDNFNKRGRIDMDNGAYHLDHRYSIREGFLNNIPVYIIGNIENLEMIPGRENCKKQANCSITLEELSGKII